MERNYPRKLMAIDPHPSPPPTPKNLEKYWKIFALHK